MKRKITEHYIKWSLVYGIAGAIVIFGTVCGLNSLLANVNALTHNNDMASLAILFLYGVILIIPSLCFVVYALYLLFFAIRPQKGLKGVRFKFKRRDKMKQTVW